MTTPTDPRDPVPVGEDPATATLHQDTFRKVYLGQASDPLFPPHPAPPEAEEEALTRAALEDPAGLEDLAPIGRPSPWRLVAVLVIMIIALGVVFLR